MTSAADTSAHTPENTNTDETSATRTSAAATNGPTMMLSESSQPRTTLIEVSSSGVRHSEGISAEWLARNGTKATVDTTASPYAIHEGPSATSTGATASVARPRTVLEATSTFSRGSRSAYVEMTGASTAAGSSRRTPTSP